MIDLSGGLIRGVQRGPDWLFIQLGAAAVERGTQSRSQECEASSLADGVWKLLERHFTYRVVLDCEKLPTLSGAQVEQLAQLRQQVDAHGGLLRLCGLSADACAMIEDQGLATQLPNYPCREDAVMAQRPKQPR